MLILWFNIHYDQLSIGWCYFQCSKGLKVLASIIPEYDVEHLDFLL